MTYLVDTNLLLRVVERSHQLHSIAASAIVKLREDGQFLRTSVQNYIEFWNVATRPKDKNGLGYTPVDAERLLQKVERSFPSLLESPDVYPEWRRLVVQHNVSGVKVYDARLVAVMKANNITHTLTFNDEDFARYASEGIVAVNPKNV